MDTENFFGLDDTGFKFEPRKPHNSYGAIEETVFEAVSGIDTDPRDEVQHFSTEGRGIGAKHTLDFKDREFHNISLSVIGEDELLAGSVAEINKEKISTNASENKNTLYDPNLGVTEYNSTCGTCGNKVGECPANHYGHIKFEYPMFNPLFRRRVVSILNCVCANCGKLYLTKSDLERHGILTMHPIRRLQALEILSKSVNCGGIQPEDIPEGCNISNLSPEKCKQKYIFGSTETQPDTIPYEISGDKKEKGNIKQMSIKQIEEILICVSESPLALRAMGFKTEDFGSTRRKYRSTRPVDYIMKYMIVISPAMRPANITGSEIVQGERTRLYKSIIASNNKLNILRGEERSSTAREKPGKNIEGDIKKLKIRIFNVVLAFFVGSPTDKSGGFDKVISLKESLQGKSGIIRANMMSKRTESSARTVITPVPTMNTNQIRVPKFMADSQSVPMKVNEYNIEHCKKLLRNGKVISIDSYKKGELISTRMNEERSKTWNLMIGQTIHRKLRNGDYVGANRQPTLHSYGIMGFEVIIADEKSLGLHMNTVSPFNADFDGDEMNIYPPQGTPAILEMASRMNAQNCLLDYKSSKSTMGLQYDAINAPHLLTLPGIKLNARTYKACYLLVTNPDKNVAERAKKYNLDLLSGRVAFSFLLPKDFNYNYGGVYIENGILLDGVITKEHVGTTVNSIPQILHIYYGLDRALMFLDDAPKMLNYYYNTIGFSAGLSDCTTMGTYLRKEYAKISKEIVESTKEAFEHFVYSEEDFTNLGETLLTELKNIDLVRSESVDSRIRSAIRSFIEGVFDKIGGRNNEEQRKKMAKINRDAMVRINKIKEQDLNIIINREIGLAVREIEELGPELSDPVREERRQQDMKAILQKLRGKAEDLTFSRLPETNAFKIMSSSGAKGDKFNISQIITILAQQYIEGKFPEKKVSNRSRCITYFPSGDTSIEASGFCREGYIGGLTPSSFFFAVHSGRIGILDLATKTAETGEMHHKINKVLEDIVVHEDGTVRNGAMSKMGLKKQIVQFSYGNTGLNPGKLVRIKDEKGMVSSNFTNWDQVTDNLMIQSGFVL